MSLFLNRVVEIQPTALFKKRSCFPVSSVKKLRETAPAKYPFVRYPQPCFFCFTLIISRENTMDRLRIAVSESSGKLAMTALKYF